MLWTVQCRGLQHASAPKLATHAGVTCACVYGVGVVPPEQGKAHKLPGGQYAASLCVRVCRQLCGCIDT
jgi:hypothetical protein